MEKKKPIRVLQVTIGDGSFGGVASFLYTYYSHMDKEKVHFDFLYCGENSMASKQNDALLKDSKITTLHILKANNNGLKEYKKLIPALKSFFEENHYDIVHVNSSNPYVNACVAYTLNGRSTYIAHSHNVQSSVIYGSKAKQVFKKTVSYGLRKYIIGKADALYACSDTAGAYLFGEKGCELKKFRIVNNAIDTNKFRFNEQVRTSVRQEAGISDETVVVGFVGRLSDQKNPRFAVEVFSKLQENCPESELWVIGEGNLKETVLESAAELGVSEKVHLLGRRNDVEKLMQAMDVFIFPSIYEGLGIVAIEAQCSGLPVVASDKIPKMTNVIGLVKYLTFNDSLSKWAEVLLQQARDYMIRVDRSDELRLANYDIVAEAEELFYEYHRFCFEKEKS